MGENRVTMSLIKRYVSVMLVAALVLTGIQVPTVAQAADTEDITMYVGDTKQLTIGQQPDVTPTITGTVTPEPTITGTVTPEPTKPVTSETPTGTVTPEPTITGTVTPGVTGTVTPEPTITGTVTPEPTVTGTVTPEPTKPVTPEQPTGTVTPEPTKPVTPVTPVTPVKPGEVTETTPNAPAAVWSSSDPSVVSVTATGLATALKAGTAKITVVAGSYTKVWNVTVLPKQVGPTTTIAPTKAPTATSAPSYIRVKSVKLNAKKITVGTKATFTLTATVNPTNAKIKTVSWSSSNKKVATVSKKGKVTAKKAGKAVITVTTKDGAKKAKCTVTVKAGVKVTYKLAGGKNNGLNPSYVAKNTKTKLAAPTRKGYAFKGWYVNGKKVSSIKTSKKITVTAKWEKVKVGAATIKTAKASGKNIKVTYAKVKGAKGYTVSYSTSKKFTKKTTKTVTAKKTTATIKNLKKGTYYVKVTAYKTDSTGAKVSGKASKVKTVKIK